MKCPYCPRLVNLGKGYGLSRRFCSTKCAHAHAQQAIQTMKANYKPQQTDSEGNNND